MPSLASFPEATPQRKPSGQSVDLRRRGHKANSAAATAFHSSAECTRRGSGGGAVRPERLEEVM